MSSQFSGYLNPLCSCSLEIESTKHYLLRCPFYTPIRKTLIDNITNAIGPISHLSDDKLVNLLLYGSDRYNTEQNSSVLKNTIVFLKSSERFVLLKLRRNNNMQYRRSSIAFSEKFL